MVRAAAAGWGGVALPCPGRMQGVEGTASSQGQSASSGIKVWPGQQLLTEPACSRMHGQAHHATRMGTHCWRDAPPSAHSTEHTAGLGAYDLALHAWTRIHPSMHAWLPLPLPCQAWLQLSLPVTYSAYQRSAA